MKRHVKVYFEGMGITPTANFDDMFVACEWCGGRAVDINHIDPRKMGGSKLRDNLEDLVALCRKDHLAFEAGKLDEDELKERHLKNIPCTH